MRRPSEPNPRSVSCQGPEEVAVIIGTRCETCHAPVWPIGAPCSYCEQARAAAVRNRFIEEAPPSPVSPTLARIEREAGKPCAWSRDVPKLDPCACHPCTARRVLAEVSR